jgi:hypothetical protein
MRIKEWMQKNKIGLNEMEEVLNYKKNYLCAIFSGRISPGKKLARLVSNYTRGEVTPEELGYLEKVKCRCPTCGRIK